jgi:hypothetical protein
MGHGINMCLYKLGQTHLNCYVMLILWLFKVHTMSLSLFVNHALAVRMDLCLSRRTFEILLQNDVKCGKYSHLKFANFASFYI